MNISVLMLITIILVREQQNVNAGQQLRPVSNGTSSVRLHFEIRYKENHLTQ